jgi:tryptophan-rich sensory protein
MPSRPAVLLAFIVLVVGGGLAIGYFTAPGPWYATLNMPAFTPPGWLFAPVWTLLYLMIAIAGWRSWQSSARKPMWLWWLQLFLNFLWPIVFFSAHQTAFAFVIIVLLLTAIVGFIASAWARDRVAAVLFVPYAVWVAFAAVLNGYIVSAN